MKFFRKLRRNEEGATAIEYGLIANCLNRIRGLGRVRRLNQETNHEVFPQAAPQ